MIEFPNYLMKNSLQSVTNKQKNHSEIVLSKPFHKEKIQRLEEQLKKQQKEEFERINTKQSTKVFKPTNLPPIWQQPKPIQPVDYTKLIEQLTLTDNDLLLFEQNDRQLHQQLEQLSEFLGDSIKDNSVPSSIVTEPIKKQSKKVNKRGLHKTLNGILEQENQASYISNQMHVTERESKI